MWKKEDLQEEELKKNQNPNREREKTLIEFWVRTCNFQKTAGDRPKAQSEAWKESNFSKLNE